MASSTMSTIVKFDSNSTLAPLPVVEKPPKTAEYFCKKYFANIFQNQEKLLGKSFEQLANDGLEYKKDLESLCEDINSVKALEATIKKLQKLSDPQSIFDLQTALEKKNALENKLIEAINAYICQIDTDKVGNKALSPFSQDKITFDDLPDELMHMIISLSQRPWMFLLVSKRTSQIAQDLTIVIPFLRAFSKRGGFPEDSVVKSFQQMTLPPENKSGLLGYLREMQLRFSPGIDSPKQLGLWELQKGIEKQLREAPKHERVKALVENLTNNNELYTTFTVLGSFELMNDLDLLHILTFVLLPKNSVQEIQGVAHKALELARKFSADLISADIFEYLVILFLQVKDEKTAIRIVKDMPPSGAKSWAIKFITKTFLDRNDIKSAENFAAELDDSCNSTVFFTIARDFLEKCNIEKATQFANKIPDEKLKSELLAEIEKASPQKEDLSNR